MKVLLISVEYPPKPGGIGVSCHRLATGLRAAGDDVVVVARGAKTDVAPNCDKVRVKIQEGISVHWLPPSFTVGAGFAWGMNHLLPLVESYRPSIVHSYTPLPAGYVGTRCAAHANVSHVVSNRGADVTQFSLMLPTPSRLVYAAADAILSVSSSFRSYIELNSGRTDVEVVANSVTQEVYDSGAMTRLDARRHLKLSTDTLTIGTLSNFRWKKGIAYLEKLLYHLGSSSLGKLQFVLGGNVDVDLLPRLRSVFERTSSATRQRRFATISNLARHEVPTFMSALDLFVSTSNREGMPNTSLESLACGTPVAATAVDGQIDLLADSKVGLMMHCFDPLAGAEQILDLVTDRSRLEAMASRCRPLIARKYLQKHEVQQIREIYQRTIANRLEDAPRITSRELA